MFMEGNVSDMPAGNARSILLQITVAILDEVFLNNAVCDRMHNRKMLDEITGMSFDEFLVLRSKCKKDTIGKIGFSPMEAIRLFQLLDCAGQILSGNIYDRIKGNLDYLGLDKKNITTYLSEVDKFNKRCRAMINKFAGASFPSMVPYHDWDKALK